MRPDCGCNRADLQPALRAAPGHAHQLHQDQQDHRPRIGRKGQPHPPGQRQQSEPDHHEEAEDEPHQLQLPEMRFNRIGVGGRIEHRNARQRHRRNQQDEAPGQTHQLVERALRLEIERGRGTGAGLAPRKAGKAFAVHVGSPSSVMDFGREAL